MGRDIFSSLYFPVLTDYIEHASFHHLMKIENDLFKKNKTKQTGKNMPRCEQVLVMVGMDDNFLLYTFLYFFQEEKKKSSNVVQECEVTMKVYGS